MQPDPGAVAKARQRRGDEVVGGGRRISMKYMASTPMAASTADINNRPPSPSPPQRPQRGHAALQMSHLNKSPDQEKLSIPLHPQAGEIHHLQGSF